MVDFPAPTFPAPTWAPGPTPTLEWTVERLHKYLHEKCFTVFEHGTCVVWPGLEDLSNTTCQERLLSVVRGSPDFKVRRHGGGDFLERPAGSPAPFAAGSFGTSGG
jgi:hypothetical protein